MDGRILRANQLPSGHKEKKRSLGRREWSSQRSGERTRREKGLGGCEKRDEFREGVRLP